MTNDSSETGRGQKLLHGAIIAAAAIVVLGFGAWALQSSLRTDEIQGQEPSTGVVRPRDQSDGTQMRRNESDSAEPAQQASTQPMAKTEVDPAFAEPNTASTSMADPSVESGLFSRADLNYGSGLIAIAGLEGVDLWDSPEGAPFLTLPTSTRLTANGRSADSSWIFVTSDDAVGWTPARQLIAFDLISLPVVTVAETPVLPGIVGNESAEQVDSMEVVAVENPVSAEPLASATNALLRSADQLLIDSTAASTIVGAPKIMATIALDDSRLNVRSGPGSGYSIIAKAYPGETYGVLGGDDTGDWIQVDLPHAEGGFGWVSTEYVHLSELANNLPVKSNVSTAPAYPPASSIIESASATVQSGDSGLSGTLVFQKSNGGPIYVNELATGELRLLTYGFDPAISADGGTVAFTRDGGENGLYLIDIDGSNERLIFSGRAGLRSPTWSPDGNWIVFSRADEFTECRQVGRGGCVSDEDLSKQGQTPGDFPLVRETNHKLARVDSNGNSYRDLATLESARAPNWNESGIVYQSDAGLQITNDVANAVNQLVVFDYLKPYYEDPAWRPNGGQIVYQGREASHMEIFAINPDGSGQVALTKPVTTLVDELPSNVSPAWSPDGEHIVYLSNRDEDNSTGGWQLWVMDVDGSNQHPLPIEVSFEYSFGGEQMVSWGP